MKIAPSICGTLLCLVIVLRFCSAFLHRGANSGSRRVRGWVEPQEISLGNSFLTASSQSLFKFGDENTEINAPLIETASVFAESKLGILDTSLIAADFQCSSPSDLALSKEKFLENLVAETKAIEKAAPDYALQPFDFQVEPASRGSPDTVWFKIRPSGTLVANFTYEGKSYLPTNRTFVMPVQQLSVTLRGGKVIKMTNEYIVDRCSGNTDGFIGPQGVLAALGFAPSTLSTLPPLVALKRSLGVGSMKPISSKVAKSSSPSSAAVSQIASSLIQKAVSAVQENVLTNDTNEILKQSTDSLSKVLSQPAPKVPEQKAKSPFIEAVMVSLSKQVINSGLGAGDDGIMLSSDFQYSDPFNGPISKKDYLADQSNLYRLQEDEKILDFSLNAYAFSIDPIEADRVWAIVRGTGKRTVVKPGKKGGPDVTTTLLYEGPPEVISMSFDKNGLCFRVTAGYPVDRTQGNTNGLGGVYGILEATKQPMSPFSTRSVSDVFRIAKEAVLPRPISLSTDRQKISTSSSPKTSATKKTPSSREMPRREAKKDSRHITVSAPSVSNAAESRKKVGGSTSSVASESKDKKPATSVSPTSNVKSDQKVTLPSNNLNTVTLKPKSGQPKQKQESSLLNLFGGIQEDSPKKKSSKTQEKPSDIALPTRPIKEIEAKMDSKKKEKSFSLFGAIEKSAKRAPETSGTDGLVSKSSEIKEVGTLGMPTAEKKEVRKKKEKASIQSFTLFGAKTKDKKSAQVKPKQTAPIVDDASAPDQPAPEKKKAPPKVQVTGLFGQSFAISKGGGAAKKATSGNAATASKEKSVGKGVKQPAGNESKGGKTEDKSNSGFSLFSAKSEENATKEK